MMICWSKRGQYLAFNCSEFSNLFVYKGIPLDLVSLEYRQSRARGILDFLHQIGVRFKTQAPVKLLTATDYLRVEDGVRGGTEPPSHYGSAGTGAFFAKIKRHLWCVTFCGARHSARDRPLL